MENQLPIAERTAAISLLFGLALLVSLSFLGGGAPEMEQSSSSTARYEVVVTIKGYVRNPGRFILEKGASLGDALALARPYGDSDLRRFDVTKPVQKPRTLTIKERARVNIFISGAVQNPGELSVYKGTRFCDLPDWMALSTEADPSFFTKKRSVKEGERVNVPSI